MTQSDRVLDSNGKPIVLLVFVSSLALYVFTCAPGVVWQDGATFQFRVEHFEFHSRLGLALAHPLYIFLCKAFTLLPLGSGAHRVNLFSAVCAAAALAVLADLLLTLTRSRPAALCGVLLLAVSHTFWKHAVMAEVMSLYALGLAIELWLVERFVSRGNVRWLILAIFVNGLDTSNHLLALLHLPAYAGLILWFAAQRRLSWGVIIKCAAAYSIGLSPYLSLIVQELAIGRSIAEVLYSALFGEAFAKDVLNTSVPIFRQIARTAEYFALNFPTPLLLAAPLGLWASLSHPARRSWAAFACGVFLVDFIFAFRYPVADQYLFFLPCYVWTATFAALGVLQIKELRGARLIACLLLAALPATVYEIGPTLLKRWNVPVPFRQEMVYRDSYDYFLRPRMNGEDSAERFARDALQSMPQNGLLIADFSTNNVLAYVRDVMGVRPDVVLSEPCEVDLAPPKESLTPESVRPYLERGATFSATRENASLPEWMLRGYDLQPDGVIFRLARKGAN